MSIATTMHLPGRRALATLARARILLISNALVHPRTPALTREVQAVCLPGQCAHAHARWSSTHRPRTPSPYGRGRTPSRAALDADRAPTRARARTPTHSHTTRTPAAAHTATQPHSVHHTPTAAPAPTSSPVPTPLPEWCGLRADVAAAAQELGFKKPTGVQERIIPRILAGESVLLTAPTGTGKTLAYVLPLAHTLKLHEESSDKARRPNRPRAVIVVPTRELAEQVLSVVKRVCHTAKLRAVALVGGGKQSTQVEAMSSPLDIVVGTPGRINLHLQNKDLFLTDLRTLVVDEADTMVHEENGFLGELERLLLPLKSRLSMREATSPGPAAAGEDSTAGRSFEPVQVLLVGATISGATKTTVKSLFPDVQLAESSDTHRVPASVDQQFVRVGGGPDTKHDALLTTLADIMGEGRHARSSTRKTPRVLVFCNTVASARSTAHFLVESGGYSTACLHGDIPPALRASQFKAFLDGTCPVLVCTDAAARGLDIPALRHVILFDFPRNTTDYLHRVGRVGRAAQTGTAISLVSPRDVTLAKHVQYLARSGLPLTRPMPASPSQILQPRVRSWARRPAAR